jgi:hypothetical protein
MQLLAEMEESLRLQIQDRDRLRQHLVGDVSPRALPEETAAAISERT